MKKTTFLIAGKHAVTEALKNSNRKVLRVFLTEDSKKTLNRENQNLDLLKDIRLFYKNKKELDRLCSKEQISHQGLIAEIEHLVEPNLKDYLNTTKNKNTFNSFLISISSNAGTIAKGKSNRYSPLMLSKVLNISGLTNADNIAEPSHKIKGATIHFGSLSIFLEREKRYRLKLINPILANTIPEIEKVLKINRR